MINRTIQTFKNAIISGTILIVPIYLVYFIYLSLLPVTSFFLYESITPTSSVYKIGEPISFISVLTRFQETNMQYNDTLFCGMKGQPLSWYSQVLGEYRNAPAGNMVSMWRYDGYLPTIPMICELRSSPYADLGFGINTNSQKITTPTFWVQ